MNRIIQQWLYGVDERSISLFASFLEKENALETLILIFENVSPKGFSHRTRISRFFSSVSEFSITDSRSKRSRLG